VIVTGILAAIFLPNPESLSHSYPRAKQVEGRNTVGAMNRAQQAYFTEKNAFVYCIKRMGIGIKSDTASYRYLIRPTYRAAFNYAIAKEPKLKSYAGAVWKVTDTDGKTTTQAILCEAKNPAATKPADPVYKDGQLLCGEGTVKLGD
jgi:hypothetical protein